MYYPPGKYGEHLSPTNNQLSHDMNAVVLFLHKGIAGFQRKVSFTRALIYGSCSRSSKLGRRSFPTKRSSSACARFWTSGYIVIAKKKLQSEETVWSNKNTRWIIGLSEVNTRKWVYRICPTGIYRHSSPLQEVLVFFAIHTSLKCSGGERGKVGPRSLSIKDENCQRYFIKFADSIPTICCFTKASGRSTILSRSYTHLSA